MSINYPTLAHFRHFSHFRHSFNYNIFPDTLFMQNKPNFLETEINANLFITKDYEKNDDSGHEKTKPIQTQFKPNQSQFWAKIKGGKAKTNPIQTQFTPGMTREKPMRKPRTLRYTPFAYSRLGSIMLNSRNNFIKESP